MFHYGSASELRPTVTVVREVEDDNEASDEDDDSSEVSWNGSDTSEDTAFGKRAGVEAFYQRVSQTN
jgi:hypothetical protein